ncbi:MAG TPA: LLM class F420-dependent oxidoreductase [Acidimicrobiales bacterium]|nr:LLM class F420-dependent oxidoreductase [Acidimicrobiales bacterium]
MKLRVFTEPQQGATYEQLLAMAKAAERGGYDAFFRSDHYMAFAGDGLPGPTDAWITLAGLARDTNTVRLGTLVTAATFRLPGPLAISVAEVDAMSDGRVELGLGAGWFEREHTAYGIPFPALAERFERLEEQLAIITGLWATPAGERFAFEGRHYQVADSPALPKPVQHPGPPLIIGGGGPRRTPRLAARYASEFNMPFSSPDDCRAQYERVRAACRDAGRPEGDIRFSAAVTVCCAATAAELERRASRTGLPLERLRASGAAGTPAEVADRLRRWADAGAESVYLQFLDVEDTDHVDLVAAEVIPQLS